ncbi:unnamed protein product [Arctogadus glacialis]
MTSLQNVFAPCSTTLASAHQTGQTSSGGLWSPTSSGVRPPLVVSVEAGGQLASSGSRRLYADQQRAVRAVCPDPGQPGGPAAPVARELLSNTAAELRSRSRDAEMERERAHGPTRSGPQGRRGQLDRGSSAPGEAQLRRTVLFLCALSVQPQWEEVESSLLFRERSDVGVE